MSDDKDKKPKEKEENIKDLAKLEKDKEYFEIAKKRIG